MLSNLLADLGLTDEQFAMACMKASANPLHQKLVAEIMAVDNFSAFKKLMCKWNKEMNEQAIHALSTGYHEPVHTQNDIDDEQEQINWAIAESLRMEEE